ncbi:MAG: hypothetical protein O7F71_01830 [Gammaproteobacteria bacterium]|nr:hypothetical protein [Gammaproteobacteria bacterium]
MGACAAGLAALWLPPIRAGAAASIGSQAFAAMVGDRFHLANYSGTDQGIAKLISVEQIGVAAELDQFHLRFRGRRGVRLSEGLYAVTNWNGHPNFDLHVLPTGVDRRDRELYIASFAQIR